LVWRERGGARASANSVLLSEIKPGREAIVGLVVRRYLIATIVFASAALWTGVAFVGVLECLLAFVCASGLVGVVQRRRLVAERGQSHRRAGGRVQGRRPARSAAGERSQAGGPVSRARASRALYDGDAKAGDWPALAERHW
jgi:hypothetical protein